ncbi:MAG: choice-of-anchor D domain-containing protein [Ignavibacteriales bacterium]|nr:choice-of-anchor D domain-containing protein [Ignavibacteriales bacterium]
MNSRSVKIRNVLRAVILLAACSLLAGRSVADSKLSPIVQLGPAGGIITCVKGTPDDAIVLVGIRDRGIFRSVDGGQSWSGVVMERMQENAGNVNDIVFSPVKPLTAYAATDWGLYKSTDGGAIWNLSAFTQRTLSLAVHPLNPDIIFFGDAIGVKRSIDGGAHYLQQNIGMPASITGLVIDPYSAASKDSLCVVAGTESDGLFRSRTAGLTWESFNEGLDSLPYKSIRSLTIIADTTRDTTRTSIYAAGTLLGPIVYREGVFKPDHWYKIPTYDGILKSVGLVLEGTTVSAFIGLSGYDWNGRAGPVKNGLMYTTLSSLFFTQTWSPLFTFPYGVDVFSLFIPNSNQAKIYVASSAGLLISKNSGNTWLPQESTKGLNFGFVRNVGIIQNKTRKSIFAGTFGGGVYRSQDEGKTWERISKGITNPYITTITTDPHNDRTVYAGGVYNVYKSTNGGDEWSELLREGYVKNWSKFTNDNEVTLRVSPASSNSLVLESAAFGFQRSIDGGANWQNINLPEVVAEGSGVENIEFDPDNGEALYYAGRGFYRSTDFGVTWTDLSGDLPRTSGNDSVRYLSPTFTPGNKNQIYLGSVPDLHGIHASTIYRTTTGGGTWLPLNVHGVDISIDRVDPSFLFVSGPDGIFHSSDAGKNWLRLDDPDPRMPITYLAATDDPLNSNVQYIGSDHGAVRLDYGVLPKLTVPAVINFAAQPLRVSTDTSFTLSNKTGAKRVILQLISMVDSSQSFLLKNASPSGGTSFVIEAGAVAMLQLTFTPQSAGVKNAYLTFQTTDPALPLATIEVHGTAVAQHFAAKTEYDFGSVLVGRDTAIAFPISNKEGSQPAVVRLLSQSNTSFVTPLRAGESLTIPVGRDTVLAIRFVPAAAGVHQGTITIGTNDEGYLPHAFTLQGAGFLHILFSKKILLDNIHGFASPFDTSVRNIQDYYAMLLASFERAGIGVVHPNGILAPSGIDAVLIAGPQTNYAAADVDSLQAFVNAGGLLVLLGNSSSGGTGILNAILRDTSGVRWKSDPGIQLEQTLLRDLRKPLPKTPIAPVDVISVRSGPYFVNADQLQFFGTTRLMVDTTKAAALLIVDAPSLVSPAGDTITGTAVVGAIAPIGSGKILVLADLDCWANDIEVGKGWDLPFGLLARENLQFALNVFGTKENYEVTMPQPTPREEYRIISIPYDLSDTAAISIFKDLGPVDAMNWRLFGQWNAAEQRYMEFPADFKDIRRGLGYWLITRGEKTLTLGVANVSAAQDTFAITLQPGWNLIGNPFPYPLSWKNSFHNFTERALWQFTGKGYVMDTLVMEPFAGYFVKSLDTLPRAVRINPVPVQTPLRKSAVSAFALGADEWMLRAAASNGNAGDADNFAGVKYDAQNEWDVLDISEPPTNPNGYVALSFLNAQWKRHAGRYAVDFHAPAQSGAYWDLEVRTDQFGKPITLSVEKRGVSRFLPHVHRRHESGTSVRRRCRIFICPEEQRTGALVPPRRRNRRICTKSYKWYSPDTSRLLTGAEFSESVQSLH